MIKQIIFFTFALILTGLTCTYGEANKIEESGSVVLTDQAVKGYLSGLKSDNNGLRLSCAYFLGQYKVPEAVIPLMDMLHNGESENARIMAALALVKIGNGLGIHVVKKAAEFDKSERVRELCKRFYNSLVTPKNELVPFM